MLPLLGAGGGTCALYISRDLKFEVTRIFPNKPVLASATDTLSTTLCICSALQSARLGVCACSRRSRSPASYDTSSCMLPMRVLVCSRRRRWATVVVVENCWMCRARARANERRRVRVYMREFVRACVHTYMHTVARAPTCGLPHTPCPGERMSNDDWSLQWPMAPRLLVW